MAHRPNRDLLPKVLGGQGSLGLWVPGLGFKVLGLGQRVFRCNSVSETRVSAFRVVWEVRGWAFVDGVGLGLLRTGSSTVPSLER